MTFSLLAFAAVTSLLLIEGERFLLLLCPESLTRSERWSLAFPFAALINALLFFLFLLLHIPLTLATIIPFHLLIILIILIMARHHSKNIPTAKESPQARRHLSIFMYVLSLVFLFLIAIKFMDAMAHAVLLPTFYYDSLMEWTMRAKTSYFLHAIDMIGDTYRNATPQPQFPILLHSLQILFMTAQGRWIDAVANGATFFLSVTSFVAFFFLLRRRIGGISALIGLWIILAIPLLTVQLGQGYADIHIVEYLLLSAILFLRSSEESNTCLLLLSGLLCAAAAWTKQEGFYFGLLPWMLFAMLWIVRNRSFVRRISLHLLPPLIIGSLWTLFILFRRMPLGPHDSDFSITWHPEGIPTLLQSLFTMGSFGIHWYIILLFALLAPVLLRCRVHQTMLLIFAWGGLMFFELLFVFLFTPNVRFLLSQQTFHRTALLPLSMLTLATLLIVIDRIQQRPRAITVQPSA